MSNGNGETLRSIAPRQAGLDDEIAELERALTAKLAAKARQADDGVMAPVPRGGALPCTYQQEGLWFLHQLAPASPVYNIPFVLRLRGTLEIPALERAVHALIGRHEALRTRFVEQDGLPRQVIDPPPAAFEVSVTDIDAGQAWQWAPGQAHLPFDLTAGSLFRVRVARLAPGEHLIVLVVHHIVADGWSLRILADELALLYAAEAGGGDVLLPPLPVQAADHAAWQRGPLHGAEIDRQLHYWRTTLTGLTTVGFPADRPRPAQPTGDGTPLARQLPDALTEAVRAYAKARHGSLLAVAQAALLVVLHRYSGQEDLAIGSTFSGRTRPETEPLVGYFATTVVLRASVAGNPSFAELVERCHETVLNGIAHQDVPFMLMVDAVRPERVAGRNPLFQINLTLQPADNRAVLKLGTVAAEPIRLANGFSRFDVAIDVFDLGDSVSLKIEYSSELFNPERMERLLDHLIAALSNGLARPHAPLAAIDIGAHNTVPPGEAERGPVPRGRGYVPPRTGTECWLAEAWRELLGVEQVGAEDNFFGLGGSSLLGMRLIARIRDRLGLQLDPRHLYTSQLLEQLAARMDESLPALAVTAL